MSESVKSAGKGKKIVLPYMEIEELPNDIVRFNLTRDIFLDMEKAVEMVEICKDIFGERKYRSLKVVHYKMKLQDEVVNFLASDARKEMIRAEAVVVNSNTLRVFGNFYLKIKKPAIKTKIFYLEEEAIAWLMKH